MKEVQEIWLILNRLRLENKSLKPQEVQIMLGCSEREAKKLIWAYNTGLSPISLPNKKFSNIDIKKLVSFLKIERTISEISKQFKLSSDEVIELAEYIGHLKFNIKFIDNSYIIDKSFSTGKLNIDTEHRSINIGFVSDTHLGSHWERLDILHEAYDHFEKKGITTVFHAGNYIEGEARFNRQDTKVFGMYPQLNYCALNYPLKKGITTFFIDGDDHEGWYAQREMIRPGEILQSTREKMGLFDLKYMGYMEADIRITSKAHWENEQHMRLAHPGGGASYAISYVFQKIVESFQGGEKPAIYVGGHYHKHIYFQYRNVHILGLPGMQDQSLFGRKKRIDYQVGFVDVKLYINELGLIDSFVPRFFMRYDRKFYEFPDKFSKY